MSGRAAIAALVIAALAVIVWRAELFTVSRPGLRARALVALPAEHRVATQLDATLPVVPVGMERLRAGRGVLLIHFWAPWERHSLAQAVALDSLRRGPGLEELEAVIVCFDPFPSVARYVGRNRLRVPVLLDGRRALAPQLPCPSIPYTYVLDGRGRIAIAQPGEVDWLAPATRAALRGLIAEPDSALAPGPAAASRAT